MATSKKSVKKVAKSAKSTKSTKKVAKTNGNREALHDTLIKMFKRPNGATLAEIKEAGYDYAPGIFALRIAERRGYKTKVVKKEGERSRYVATGSATA